MDMTYVVSAIILLFGTILTAFVSYAWKSWVRPWIESKNLETEAGIVVNAVEALLGRYTGEDKWKLALEKMEAFGWNIDADKVIDAVKAAWQLLNLRQIEAGVKEPESVETGEVME